MLKERSRGSGASSPLQHRFVDGCDLSDDIQDGNFRRRWQTQHRQKPPIGLHVDAGHIGAADVEWDVIGFAVGERRKDSFSRQHGPPYE